MPVQLALQGGGAKLMALLAAMEGVQEMDEKQLKVTRLSGTSAGAIVACLYAAGIHMDVARTELVRFDATTAAGIFRWRIKVTCLMARILAKASRTC